MSARPMIASPAPRPGLRRYPLSEQQAAARQKVAELYQFADFYGQVGEHFKPGLAKALRDAAVLLDEYRAGGALEPPHPNSGWVLLPATLPAKVTAAIEALIAALSESDHLAPLTPRGMEVFYPQHHAALEGGRAVLAAVEAAR